MNLGSEESGSAVYLGRCAEQDYLGKKMICAAAKKDISGSTSPWTTRV